MISFKQVFRDHARLVKGNKRYKVTERRTPHLDWLLYTRPHGRIKSPDEGEIVVVEEDGNSDEDHSGGSQSNKALRNDMNEPRNSYLLRVKFLQQWRYAIEPELATFFSEQISHRIQQNKTHFDNSTLCSHDLEGELAVYEYSEHSKHPPGYGHGYDAHKSLDDKISSQLLYYRLTTIFGMPPQRKLNAYYTWRATLIYKDGESCLEVGDCNGSATVYFHGTKEAKASALALLSFLTGLNCPHPYEGVVAGTQAWM
jgi:hypothetical protein